MLLWETDQYSNKSWSTSMNHEHLKKFHQLTFSSDLFRTIRAKANWCDICLRTPLFSLMTFVDCCRLSHYIIHKCSHDVYSSSSSDMDFDSDSD